MKTDPAAAKPRRGRKPANESRATEIRRALAKWRQIPEEHRPSLRALAAELNTSHQLLCSYLRTLDEWLYRQRSEEYGRMAKEILDRATAEGRSMTQPERELFTAFNREAGRCALMALRTKATERIAEEMHRAAKKGKRAEAKRCAELLALVGNEEGKRFLKTGEMHHSGRR